jgi:hypothetical protein
MRIIDLNPSLAKPHSRVGRILLQEGRREEALVHLSAAVRFDPLDSETRHLIESLLTKAE